MLYVAAKVVSFAATPSLLRNFAATKPSFYTVTWQGCSDHLTLLIEPLSPYYPRPWIPGRSPQLFSQLDGVFAFTSRILKKAIQTQRGSIPSGHQQYHRLVRVIAV
jgi:REP element-mobilizing transposase RayT